MKQKKTKGRAAALDSRRDLAGDRRDNLLARMITWESGLLDGDEAVAMFQELIDNGMAWKLQGHYGRTAVDLIRRGLCSDGAGK